MTKKLNTKEIIERGYIFEEEYELIQTELRMNMEKLVLKANIKNGPTESLWIYPLEPSYEIGKIFHFIFCNDPIMFSGSPRPVAGLVGIATSCGPSVKAVASADECIVFFEKTGQEAIDYFWKKHDEYKSKKKQS